MFSLVGRCRLEACPICWAAQRFQRPLAKEYSRDSKDLINIHSDQSGVDLVTLIYRALDESPASIDLGSVGRRWHSGTGCHPQLVVLDIDRQGRAGTDLSSDDRSADASLELMLQIAFERSRSVDGVEAGASDELASFFRQFEGHTQFRQSPAKIGHLEVDDLLELCQGQRFEEDDVVDAVEKLGPELPPAAPP